jgi:esterase/lipase superfamily enzyme
MTLEQEDYMLRLGFLTTILVFLAACTPRLEIVGIDNPDIPARAVAGATQHKVFIATTREDTEVVGALFSELRADELGLASVSVSIPPNREPGAVQFPRSLPPDPRREFAIIDPSIYGSDQDFLNEINAELLKRPPAARELLFFVHGYNMSTSDAILQVGQFVEDSAFEGVPVLFAWASAARLSYYVYDLNSALIARPLLIDAAEIASRSIATQFHIFAHSMGGFLTMEAIVDAAQKGEFNRTGRLRNIVLASPDIDLDLFRSQVGEIEAEFDRFFVLLSQDDYALRASRIVAGGVQRVGAASADDLGALGVIAIDLSEVSDSRSDSHSKFSGSPEIVQLLGQGLNEAPEYGVRPRSALGQVLGDLPIRVVGGGL